jgi:hypothetical protein
LQEGSEVVEMPERNAKGVAGAVTRGATGVAGGTLKKAGSVAREATGAVPDVTGTGAVQGVGEQAQATTEGAAGAVQGAGGAVEQVEGAVAGGGGAGGERTVRDELRTIVREAALEVLVPVARKATREVAMYAVKRGPELARGKIAPKLGAAIEEAGGPGALAKDALSSVSTARAGMLEKIGIGAEAPSRPWRERPLPVEESIDVVAPVDTAYQLFTEFDEYANVLSRGEVVGELPNERIEWMRTDRGEDSAVITFHRLSDRLTRVMVSYDHEPEGMLDRAGALFGRLPRALHADLMRFKAFAEMPEEDTEEEEEPEEKPRRTKTASRRSEGRRRAKPTTASAKNRSQESRR